MTAVSSSNKAVKTGSKEAENMNFTLQKFLDFRGLFFVLSKNNSQKYSQTTNSSYAERVQDTHKPSIEIA